MNNKPLLSQRTAYILALFLIIVFTACSSDQSRSSGLKITDKTISEGKDPEDKIDIAKKVFYSLPSSVETAILLKNAGATYDEDLLNPTSNSFNYNTNLKMALNLGIYSTDLSYASLFEQSQTILDYVNVTKRMAEGLSIIDVIDESTIRRLEENINNKDVIIDIISETLLNSNSFLEDKGLQSTASFILVGGWIEGLFIAVNLASSDPNRKENQLIDRIAEQKFTLEIVINLLKDLMDNTDVQVIMKDIEDLKQTFDKVKITQANNQAEVDLQTNVTLLKSETTIKISNEVFKELTNKIKEIRTRYIS